MTDQPTLLSEPVDIKLIVIDVDNTLLNSSHELSERNERAIKTALAKGVRVMLATGKTHAACGWIIERLGIREPGIYSQGLAIQEPDGTIRHQQTLDPEIARKVITFAEDRGYAVIAYAQDRLLARSKTPYVEEIHTKWKETNVEYVGPLQNMLSGTPINKLVALSAYDERKIKALRWQLDSQLDGTARLMSGGVPHMLEIIPLGGSKGTALKSLLRELSIHAKNVMAIGDAENDLEMIMVAGVGIAVANAQPALKEAADEITASNDDDGVAKVIERYVLSDMPPAASPEPPANDASINATPPATEDAPPPEPEVEEPALPKPEDAVPPAGGDDSGA